MRKSVDETLDPSTIQAVKTRGVRSFGASVVIHYEYNEFVREQGEKRRFRSILACLVVFFPACVLFAWGITHLVLGVTALASSSRLSYVVNKNVQIALATIQLNFEGGEMAQAMLSTENESRLDTTSQYANFNLTLQQRNTDQALQSALLWDRTFFATDRPTTSQSGQQFNYTKYSELHDLLIQHRQELSIASSLTNLQLDGALAEAVLRQWQWYRALTNDIYGQITEVFLAHPDLPIWPNFLDTDYAVLFHRMLNHKRILGTFLLHQGVPYAAKLPVWYDLVGYISTEELLYSSAFFMAPSFRRFVRNVQNNEKARKINWTIIADCDSVLQNIFVTESVAGNSFPPVPMKGDAYFTELTNLMLEVQEYAVRSSGRILTGLAEQEAADYAKCAWSAVLLCITFGGGLLNIYAIWSFIQHFVTQVRESAVEHRDKTLDLRMERRKTNMVLHTMLPRKVADELKFRKFVRPIYYESVSMYFSDVQGFTALSSRSQPQDIVIMLTELYTKFDDILNDYKVWKLETIGDAYCIIAGATNQNEFESPMEHAMEIVNCSLDIRDYIRHFPIPHLPDELVKIRIGVHMGSVVAGVAGVGMHRYCVVGDALRVVEEVEASGMHGRVHLSEAAKNAIFAVASSETLDGPAAPADTESVTLNHPNRAKYVCVRNTDAELIMHGRIIKTYWIDRRDSDFARSLEGAMVKKRSYGEVNLLHPGQEALLRHRTSQAVLPRLDVVVEEGQNIAAQRDEASREKQPETIILQDVFAVETSAEVRATVVSAAE
ncbi:putative Receptor-type guanylate cyclase gcy-3 [Hypsibius exemplaris]|uniref:Receptor-type guanylate cyclase gcy-3 n=1 Tax=Hypsibius exemplaris TaxID=2072580 RepID=A0A1W0WHE2_HYPEX|nr:putative Receptor-type guanylate cyclase gcy-3 [Hypsibius exemplaris]